MEQTQNAQTKTNNAFTPNYVNNPQREDVHVHRTGTITFGSVLIIFGGLLLLHMFIPALNYMIIFKLWPCILIALGIEVLIANARPNFKFVYDKWAIVLLIILSFFAMGMAGMEMVFEYGATCINF